MLRTIEIIGFLLTKLAFHCPHVLPFGHRNVVFPPFGKRVIIWTAGLHDYPVPRKAIATYNCMLYLKEAADRG
jgi:hypothetical protein